MSDPVTNVEIEDVLSSIRRLVSNGDRAREAVSGPTEVSITQVKSKPVAADTAPESPTDRFVLTPALMVVDGALSDENPKVEVEEGTDDGWFRGDDTPDDTQETADEETSEVAEPDNTDAEADGAEHEDAKADAGEADEGPLELTNMIWEPVDPDPVEEEAASDAEPASEEKTGEEGTVQEPVVLVQEPVTHTTPDRSELVATIAELEAAVGSDGDDFEPDGSEVMGQTIMWPGAVARSLDGVEDAQSEDAKPQNDQADEGTAPEVTAAEPEETPSFTAQAEALEEPVFSHHAETTEAEAASEDYDDDDLDGLLEAGGVALDEEALRALVSEVVREELTGPLGERITRNVRKLVRREIYRILSSQEFD